MAYFVEILGSIVNATEITRINGFETEIPNKYRLQLSFKNKDEFNYYGTMEQIQSTYNKLVDILVGDNND